MLDPCPNVVDEIIIKTFVDVAETGASQSEFWSPEPTGQCFDRSFDAFDIGILLVFSSQTRGYAL